MSEQAWAAQTLQVSPGRAPAQGQGLIDLTRKIAGAILQRAGEEAEKIRREAAEQGYRDGVEEARRQAVQEREAYRRELLGQVGARVQKVEQELVENWTKVEGMVKQELTEALFKLAGQSMGRLLRESPQALAEAMSEAVTALDPRNRVQLRLHPEDLQRIVGLSELPGLEHCDLQADRAIERGGFVVRSEVGEIDGQWSARVGKWREELAAGA